MSSFGEPSLDLPGLASRTLRLYEQAWEQAGLGGPLPLPEVFLEQVPEPLRDELRPRLTEIAQRSWQKILLIQGSGADTLAMGPLSADPLAVTLAGDELPVTANSSAETIASTIANPPPAFTSQDATLADLDATHRRSSANADVTLAADSPTIGGTIDSGWQDAATIDAPSSDRGSARPAATIHLGASVKAAGDRMAWPEFAAYEVVGELGRGGVGVVYKAKQKRPRRIVALKMLLAGAHAGTDQVDRFLIEAEAVAKLIHPNIVQIYEVGEQDGLPFFSLEFVPAGSLQSQLAGKPLPDREAARLIEIIARAVAFAHEKGIVHRDLKPGNILLSTDGSPKITDFGLAKRLDVEEDGSNTRSGSIMGSPSYMAPEQAQGDTHAIGPLSDVYALGAMLYEFLSGRPPFIGARVLDTLEQVRSQEPVPPSRLQPKVSRDLETICLKCLQKEPRKRYESATAMADDVQRFLDGKSILARPVSIPERAWRWCLRNPGIAALSAVVLALMMTVATMSTVAAVTIARKQSETEKQRKLAVEAKGIAEEQKELAQEAEAKANENAKIASESLYSVITDIDSQLSDVPGLQGLRRSVLEGALDRIDQVYSTESIDLSERARIGGLQRSGDIRLALGMTDEALENYLKALAIVETQLSKDPANDVATFNQAVAYEKLGDVNEALGETRKAGDYFRSALDRRLKLRSMTIVDPRITPELLDSVIQKAYRRLGLHLLHAGDPAGAWESLRQAFGAKDGAELAKPSDLSAALEASLGDTETRLDIDPWMMISLGKIAVALGDVESSEWLTSRALERTRADVAGLAAEAKVVPLSLRQLEAAALDYLGDLDLLNRNDPAAALAHYREANTIYRKLFDDSSQSPAAEGSLALSFYRLGSALLRLDDSTGSADAYRASLEIRQKLARDDPSNVYRQLELMTSLARCGLWQESDRRADELKAHARVNPDLLFQFGCVRSLCAAVAKDEADRGRLIKASVAALVEAIDNGFRDRNSLETDPDLDTVRSQPDFARVLDRLQTR